jgi:ATP-dependent DNA helicase PIF1
MLNLKIGLPVMLIRNINPAAGLCNGTRLIVKKIFTRIIEAEISFGAHKGQRVLIPRMALIPNDTDLPFNFQRLQFPLRPSFCMTINKAQGQTLDYVSVWLGDEHVFTHGQLYVALSRVSSLNNLKIAINNPLRLTRNVVYTEIF